MKEFIKKLLLLNKNFYMSYIKFQLFRSKLYFGKKTSKLKSGKILAQSELVSKVTSAKVNKGSKVCHIIGSGWSLHESVTVISDKDFVIGFNYAGLIGIPFDVYFVEFGGDTVKNISHQHLSIVEDYVSKHTNLIFFKNLWEDKNDMEFVNNNWLGIATPIKDRIYPMLDKKYLDSVIEAMLSDRTDYLPQLTSSVVTSIILAYKAGFEKIVVHGLDFGGRYFYEVDGFQVDSTYIPDKKPEGGFYGITKKNSVHPTASGNAGMKEVVPELKACLKKRGVNLFCATSISPVSRVLPLYGLNS
ncbi:hypothetical protein JCM30760_05870 [Thiomicrorhabdus hydrogeniphila]